MAPNYRAFLAFLAFVPCILGFKIRFDRSISSKVSRCASAEEIVSPEANRLSSSGVLKVDDETALLSLQVSSGQLKDDVSAYLASLKLYQSTSGPIPRSYLPSLMVLIASDLSSSSSVYSLIEEGLRWYLDMGGRLSKLELACATKDCTVLESLGFEALDSNIIIQDEEKLSLRSDFQPLDFRILRPNPPKLKEHCFRRLSEAEGDVSNLYDIIGRIMHDMGDPRGSIEPYTKSLQSNPASAATFRNLGSAYHAVGDTQLAFASYQQAIQLDPNGL
jgi:tetratricopeptide (TPR) repeat protein